MKENRKAVRVDADGPCNIFDIESLEKSNGFLKDLSVSGIGFFSYEKYDIGQLVKIKCSLGEETIEAEGVIVFALKTENNVNRYGLEINDIENESFETLKKYVTKGIKSLWVEKMHKYSNLKK